MKKFVELVDGNAQVKAYTRALGLNKPQIGEHLKNLSLYREVVRLSDKIKSLIPNKKNNKKEIQNLRSELNSVIERWRNV